MTATSVSVWAPRARRVDLLSDVGSMAMVRSDGGWFTSPTPLDVGTAYGFSLDGGPPRPDPRAVWLPEGVHAPGRVYDHAAFTWSDPGWTGRDWSAAVLYEVHVGTFTPEGTFEAAARRLDHLVDLGVTHLELLPVCAFDGDAGWGYDGVAPWSVHEPYGGPDGLKRLVDAAHAVGLAVIIDVVHNHLGPSGNYLADFGPYFTDRSHTPWGEAVNLDAPGSDEVRAYLLGSVEAWVRDFHADGVRLDAVHELHDGRALTFLEQMSARTATLERELGRGVVVIAESDRNDPRTVAERRHGGLGMTAQWDDDVHHALHTWLTGESQGYYADFASDPAEALRAVYTGVFFHAGTYSSFRGRTHGRPVDVTSTPATRFVASLQTHDQVGNRALGERLSALAPPGHLAAGAALLLLGPFVPMLFMGEEWGARTPWLFFSSFPDADLARAVTEGRRAEFADHGWSAGDIPDPQDPSTVEASRLDWSERERAPHAQILAWYRTLLRLRHENLELRDPWLADVSLEVDGRRAVLTRGSFTVVAWLGEGDSVVDLPSPGHIVAVFAEHADSPDVSGSAVRPQLMMPGGSVAVVRR